MCRWLDETVLGCNSGEQGTRREVLEQAMLHSEMVTPTPRSHDEAESRVSHTCESGYHKPLAASWLNQGNIQVFSEMNPLLLLADPKRH